MVRDLAAASIAVQQLSAAIGGIAAPSAELFSKDHVKQPSDRVKFIRDDRNAGRTCLSQKHVSSKANMLTAAAAAAGAPQISTP